MTNIHVILYSDVKRFTPSGSSGRFDLTLPEGATLKDVFTLLALPDDLPVTALVNGRRVQGRTRFKKGDTLVIFPEICGG